MEIKVIAGNIAKTRADAIIVPFFEGMERPGGDIAAIDKALDGAISQLISQGEIKGKLNEITIIHSLSKLPAVRVVIAGLGKQQELSQDKVRGAIAEVCRLLRLSKTMRDRCIFRNIATLRGPRSSAGRGSSIPRGLTLSNCGPG
ncbi:unnamed protein product [marine sediment metagenome]|uniref:Peptidase M17 leucyl aminopeptidase N-terminal domain-containing protein n=1 Tax=marine sediment metagenome TaxID=412755 RepID=X1MGH1_9ZZZZ